MQWYQLTKTLSLASIRFTNILILELINKKNINYTKQIISMARTDPIRPVYISGYDLSKGALEHLKLAEETNIKYIWHTCIEIGTIEYYFQDGIKIMHLSPPIQDIFVEGFTESNEKAIIKKQLYHSSRYYMPLIQYQVGYTYLNDEEINILITSELTNKYNSYTYDLLYNNCNNFTNEMLYLICYKTTGVPKFILESPKIFIESNLSKNPIFTSFFKINGTEPKKFNQHDNISMTFNYINESHLDISHLKLSEEDESRLFFNLNKKKEGKKNSKLNEIINFINDETRKD